MHPNTVFPSIQLDLLLLISLQKKVKAISKQIFGYIFSVPDLLVLNGFDIDCAGEPDGLRKKCSTVKELDLAQNKLKSWNEVFSILSHMPRVEFVNLSLNLLSGPVEPPPDFGLTRLRSLVLNNTRLDWESVEALINSLDTLEELHLSLNDYHNVLIDTLDDDVFHEMNDFKDDLNDTEDNDTENDEAASEQNTTKNSNSTDKESVCTSCGLQTQAKDTKRSKFASDISNLFFY